MTKEITDLGRVLKYDGVDRKINVILDQLFHNCGINEEKVREFETLLETFVNKLSVISTSHKLISGKKSGYQDKRLVVYEPLIGYLDILVENKQLTKEQGQLIVDKYLVELETEIVKNIVNSYNKVTVEDSISRKWN